VSWGEAATEEEGEGASWGAGALEEEGEGQTVGSEEEAQRPEWIHLQI